MSVEPGEYNEQGILNEDLNANHSDEEFVNIEEDQPSHQEGRNSSFNPDEDVRAPIEEQVIGEDGTIHNTTDDVKIESFKYDSQIFWIEKVIYGFIYEMWKYNFEGNQKPRYISEKAPKVTFCEIFVFLMKKIFNFWSDSGVIALVCDFIPYLQILSMLMLPFLLWSVSCLPFVRVLTFFRTFQLQYLFFDAPNITQSVGESLNFYFPFIFSVSFCLVLFFSYFMCFFPCIRRTFIGSFVMKFSHFLITINSALFIPIIDSFFNTIFCFNSTVEINVSSCWDLDHFYFACISIIFLIPYFLFSLFVAMTHYEWRPNTPNWAAKPHSRYTFFFLPLCFAMDLATRLFSSFPIVCLFFDFIVILALLCLHVFFMQWYHKFVNLIISSFLFMLVFCCLIVITLSSVQILLYYMTSATTDLPAVIFYLSLILSTILAALITQLRFRVIGLTVNTLTAPRMFQIFYRLRPDEVVVPKGDFEVEMAAKTADVYNFSVDKLNEQEQLNNSLPEEEEKNDLVLSENVNQPEKEDNSFNKAINNPRTKLKAARKVIERVQQLYTNSLDVGLIGGDYIALSYSLFHAFVLKDFKRAITILITKKTDKRIFFLDFRLMYYVRLRYYLRQERLSEDLKKKEEEEKRKDEESALEKPKESDSQSKEEKKKNGLELEKDEKEDESKNTKSGNTFNEEVITL